MDNIERLYIESMKKFEEESHLVEEIVELNLYCHSHKYNYYVENISVISDYEFDMEFKKLEEKFEKFIMMH